MIASTVFTVNEINSYIKSSLENDQNLKYIFVKGEVSNFKKQSNGHLYFTLKDEHSNISCMMFNGYASSVKEEINNGDEVVVKASISVYVPRGSYSLLVYEMNNVGAGKLLLDLEKLKKKLASEGLFDIDRKRPINLFPKAIGVITAKTGAAIKDIVENIKRRYPIADIYLFPSAVQGEDAAQELIKAFKKASTYDLDTIIIGRGGGASEDLSAFNDETLVRTIASSKIPTIAAVGHEIDSTLVDFVADKRASTPTGAAELSCIDQREIYQKFVYATQSMVNSINQLIDDTNENLSFLKTRLVGSLSRQINEYRLSLQSKKEKLDAINPTNVLKRGYSITFDNNGKPILDSTSCIVGQEINTMFNKGKIISKIKGIN